MVCEIRPWRITDAPQIVIALNNKNVQDNLRDGIPFPYTIFDAEIYIRKMLEVDTDSRYSFAITVNDQAVGSIGVFRQGNIHYRTAEMGYYISEPYWGQGIGTRAVQLTCDFVFQNSDILRIFAEPFADNVASCRILEKAGFMCEGILRKNAVKNGVVKDMKMYSIIKDDGWKIQN